MWQLLARTFEQLVLPPGLFLVLFAASLFLLSKKPALGKASVYAILIAFYLCSTPYFAGLLIRQVESHPALDASSLGDPSAGAIVLLSGDMAVNASEYGSDTVGGHTLLRTRYAAFLQRETGLPILVSGGLLSQGATSSLAQVMADTLKQDFNAGEVWLEDKSLSTAENARYSQTVLAQKQVDRIFLVTQAWHMPRAVAVFEKTGLSVIPAPTAFLGTQAFNWNNILPSPGGISMSRYALREVAAYVWYLVRY